MILEKGEVHPINLLWLAVSFVCLLWIQYIMQHEIVKRIGQSALPLYLLESSLTGWSVSTVK